MSNQQVKCRNCGKLIDKSSAYHVGKASYYCNESCFNAKKSKQASYKVYMHINKINDKKYIGITKERYVENRWKENGRGYKTQQLFYRAIQKYGWNNFEHVVLYDDLTEEEAKNKERELIAHYKTYGYDHKYGYNLTNGGDNFGTNYPKLSEKRKGINNPMYGKNSEDYMSKERIDIKRQRMSKSLSGKVFTEEHKQKLKESHTGKKLTDEQKVKRSECFKQKYQTDLEYRKKVNETQRKSAITRTGKKFTEERKRNISNALKEKYKTAPFPRSKKVICDGIIYNCIKDCAAFYNVKYYIMLNWLSLKYKMPENFMRKGLKYYIDLEENI